jgi:hypothetical protein
MCERAVVTNALLLLAAHHAGSRELLVEGDGEIGVALVVAIANVVARTVLLDEVDLEV